MRWFLIFLMFLSLVSPAGVSPPSENDRAKQLKAYIQKERANFNERELQRLDARDELDSLNKNQNQVRERIHTITQNHQEMAMALDNLSMELQKRREIEQLQKKRQLLFLKVVYKIRKDGLVKFLARGEELQSVAARMRLLFHALRSHSHLTKEMEDRAKRLSDGEKRLVFAKAEVTRLLSELNEQEILLSGLLKKKKALLRELNHQQRSYNAAMKEYKEASQQVSTLFDSFDNGKNAFSPLPSTKSFVAPLEFGKIVKRFGKHVHEKFHTVTYQKGVEIAAEQNSEVRAILGGTVEFEGWVRGLGNVIIVHHGGGFYSLCGHLFKTLKYQGSNVEKGETIGLVGDTGNNETPSLYFEIRDKGKAVDPLAYFTPAEVSRLN